MAFTRSLSRVIWPQRFKPDLPQGYDGSTNPVEFVQLNTTSIQAAGGDEKVMANWFSHALKGSALSWLCNLPEKSIDSWAELCTQLDRKSTRLNSSHITRSRMPSSA